MVARRFRKPIGRVRFLLPASAMLTCSYCKLEKAEIEFHRARRRRTGRQPRCKLCAAIAHKKHYTASGVRRNNIRTSALLRRRELKAFLDAYRATHPCVDCGEADPIVLEFDHVRGSKREEVTRMINRGLALSTIQAEIEKCDVRCANCHRRKTTREARSNHKDGRPKW